MSQGACTAVLQISNKPPTPEMCDAMQLYRLTLGDSNHQIGQATPSKSTIIVVSVSCRPTLAVSDIFFPLPWYIIVS